MARNTFYIKCSNVENLDRSTNSADVIFNNYTTLTLKSTKTFIPLSLYRFYWSTVRDLPNKEIAKLDDTFVLEISRKIKATENYYNKVTFPLFTKAIFFGKSYYIGYDTIFSDRWELIAIYALKKKEVFKETEVKYHPVFLVIKKEYEKDNLIKGILKEINSDFKKVELDIYQQGVAIPTFSNEITDFIGTYSESKSLYQIYTKIKDVIRK